MTTSYLDFNVTPLCYWILMSHVAVLLSVLMTETITKITPEGHCGTFNVTEVEKMVLEKLTQ